MIGWIFLGLLCLCAIVIAFALCKVSTQSEESMKAEYEKFMQMKGYGK